MGRKIWQLLEGVRGKMKLIMITAATLIQPFHILTTTTLSLLLPLSFLLLARLSTSHYLFALGAPDHPQTQYPCSCSSFLISLFLKTNPSLLHALVSLITAAALIHGLTGQKQLVTNKPEPINFRPHLCISWILLCTLQVCVGLGIEESIAEGIDGSGFGHERSLISRVIFFLGLHETMLYWWRAVVKPVVDDTVFGFAKGERWVERVAMGGGFGALWWWRLRDEVEWLVVMVEVKRDMVMGVGVADFVGWWLYYLIVTIGMVRFLKGIMLVALILLCRRVVANPGDSRETEDNKV